MPTKIYQRQAFRFMVGPGHCPMISKYGPSPSGPVDPSFLVVKKSHYNKKYSSYSKSTNSTKQKVNVGSQYSKHVLSSHSKKDKTKILITNGSLMKVERIAECFLEMKSCSKCLTIRAQDNSGQVVFNSLKLNKMHF